MNGFKCTFLREVGFVCVCVGVFVGILQLFVVIVLKIALILQTF